MKIFALSFLIACSIKMAKADNNFAQILTEDDRTHVLRLIDNACEQYWCEGRYDFKFKSFACDENSATCRLRFKILDRGFIPGKFSEKYTSCVFKDIKSSAQIFEEDQLNVNFFRDLDACITLVTEE
jgi:hypothetical protein